MTYKGHVLQPLGVPPDAESVYRVLLRNPRQTVTELAATAGRGPRSIRAATSTLESLGLVSRLPGRPARLVATPPDTAVDLLVARRETEVAAIRRAAAALASELPAEHRPEDQLRIVFGKEAVAAQFLQLQQAATAELRVLDRPPYAQDPQQPNPAEHTVLSRGVRVRGIYAPEALEVPGALALLHEAMVSGEEARLYADVPLKLAIADHTTAILPFTGQTSGMIDSALVVYAPTLLDALVKLFDLLWQVAEPVLPPTGDGQDDRLLSLLSAGLKDEAIARQLGISLRTVHRRTSELSASLGARTRFQAGVLAERRGLVPGRVTG
jgi:sugar-specific transcriptional regulator TrmB